MATGTISSKGQITIPKTIREFLKVEPSDKIVFTPLEEGKVLITYKQSLASNLFGMLKHRRLEKPVTLEKMEETIRERRTNREKQ
jgi:antitoxin PrlF